MICDDSLYDSVCDYKVCISDKCERSCSVPVVYLVFYNCLLEFLLLDVRYKLHIYVII